MTMETKHYVPLEIARRLKEKGYQRGKYAANEMALPTYEQAIGWIGRKYGILIGTIVTVPEAESNRKPKYYGLITPSRGNSTATTAEPTEEQALNRAIIKVLESIYE